MGKGPPPDSPAESKLPDSGRPTGDSTAPTGNGAVNGHAAEAALQLAEANGKGSGGDGGGDSGEHQQAVLPADAPVKPVSYFSLYR